MSGADSGVEIYEGDLVEVTVGAVAHGGHCVARIGGGHGRVVFVRHALPGERVTVRITDLHRAYLRGDAVRVHRESADRVAPPCPYARPGACGGCDLQHVAPAAQLDWKTAVVREQLARLAGLPDFPVRVQALPGGPLGWRTRVRYAVDAAGRAGLLQHRSHQVVPIERCLIAHPAIQALPVLSRRWATEAAVEVVASSGGDVSVLARGTGGVVRTDDDMLSGGLSPADDRPRGAGLSRPGDGPRGGGLSPAAPGLLLDGPAEVLEIAAGRDWHVPAEGFWQVHPAAADTLVGAVLDLLDPAPGETAWDLYGGAGLFAAAVAQRTAARMTVVESSAGAVAAARANLADLAGVEVVAARVDAALSRRRITGPVDLVVLDPPRTGAGASVVRSIMAAGPRAVAYVACDPAALARDVATFRAAGWELAELRGYDCFPMTRHVECVALLVPVTSGPRQGRA